MKISPYLLTILSLTGLGLFSSLDRCWAESGYVLKQSAKLTGPQVIVVSDSAVKITESNTGITYLCQKPQWLWQIFNQHTKRFYQCAPEKFKGNASERVVIFLHDKLNREKFRKIDPAKILNEPVVRFQSYLASGSADADRPPARSRLIQISLLAHDQLPQKVREAVGRVLGMPLGGIPLDVIYIDEFDSTRNALITVNLQKKPLVREDFAAPQQCQAVKNENEVYTHPERDEDIGEFFKSR